MKKITALLAAVVVFVGFGAFAFGGGQTVAAMTKTVFEGWTGSGSTSSGKTTIKELTLQKYNKVDVDGPIRISFTQSETRHATVTARSEVMQYFRATIKNGQLRFYLTQDYYNRFKKTKGNEVKISLFGPNIKSLSVGVSADFIATTLDLSGDLTIDATTSADIEIVSLKANKLTIDGRTSADIKIKNLNVQRLTVSGSTSADVEFNGNANVVAISSDTSADVKADNLKAKNVRISAGTSGDVKIGVLTATDVVCEASTSGDIKISDGVASTAIYSASTSGDINCKHLKVTNVRVSKSTSGSVSYWKGANAIVSK